jgi:cephalosporin hydroxylase
VPHSVTGAGWRAQFDAIRWSPFGGRTEPTHGGERVIAIETATRPMGTILAEIESDLKDHRDTIDAFHRVFYASRHTHGMTFYEGVPILKSPLDLWVYQEILWDIRPTLLIETGTAYGGSALYFARQFDRIGAGKVISIDLEPAARLPQHDRISYVSGYSSTLPSVLRAVAQVAETHPRVMVVLDSDHSKRHVMAEMDAYAGFVTKGQFMVVEDTNINGRPVPIDWRGGPGPGPACDEWCPDHPEFEQALLAQRYLMSFHTWLRRTADDGSQGRTHEGEVGVDGGAHWQGSAGPGVHG